MLKHVEMDPLCPLQEQFADKTQESVILINVFEVDPKDDEAFKIAWAKDAAFSRRSPDTSLPNCTKAFSVARCSSITQCLKRWRPLRRRTISLSSSRCEEFTRTVSNIVPTDLGGGENMTWKGWAIVCFVIALIVMPVWPYSQNWGWAKPAFFWFLAALMIVMSLFRGAVKQEEDRELKQERRHKND